MCFLCDLVEVPTDGVQSPHHAEIIGRWLIGWDEIIDEVAQIAFAHPLRYIPYPSVKHRPLSHRREYIQKLESAKAKMNGQSAPDLDGFWFLDDGLTSEKSLGVGRVPRQPISLTFLHLLLYNQVGILYIGVVRRWRLL